MTRRAENPDAFQEAHYAFQDLLKEQPVPNDQLFASLQRVEDIGQTAVANGYRKMNYVAKFIRQDVMSIAEVEVVPPLDQDQLNRVAGKVEFWGQLLESSAPKKREPRQQPTPTERITTNRRK